MYITNTDVLIVGGGPAGASAALSLLNYSQHSVTLIEQSDFNRIRVGEHVSASIFDLIEYLKIEKSEFEANSFIPVYGNTTYWGSDQPNTTNSIFTTEESRFQLDREKFDFKLIEEASKRGAIIFPRSKCIEYKQLEDKNWEVLVKHPEKGNFTIHTQYLVDATGRTSNVCRQVDVTSKKYDTLMGVGTFLHHEKKTLQFEQTLEAVELGWWYSAILPDNTIVVTFFTDADIISEYNLNQIDSWNKMLQKTKYIKRFLEDTTSFSDKLWVRNAQTQISNSSSVDRFIAIGDASASFDPISSMGIGFSISSACHAAKHIQNELSQDMTTTDVFQQDIEKNFNQYLELRKMFYQQEKRWTSSIFWKRRK